MFWYFQKSKLRCKLLYGDYKVSSLHFELAFGVDWILIFYPSFGNLLYCCSVFCVLFCFVLLHMQSPIFGSNLTDPTSSLIFYFISKCAYFCSQWEISVIVWDTSLVPITCNLENRTISGYWLVFCFAWHRQWHFFLEMSIDFCFAVCTYLYVSVHEYLIMVECLIRMQWKDP